MTPLRAIEEVWRQEYESAVEEFKLEKERAELALTTWKESYKTAIKKKKSSSHAPGRKLYAAEAQAVDRRGRHVRETARNPSREPRRRSGDPG